MIADGRWLRAFAAGFAAVAAFHQPTLWVLSRLEFTSAVPYSWRPVGPLAVPLVLSACFWGGVWGLAFERASRSWAEESCLLKALAFGALGPTSVAWFVVAPLKGLPVAAGWKLKGMLTGLCVNAAWGLGTALMRGRLSYCGRTQ